MTHDDTEKSAKINITKQMVNTAHRRNKELPKISNNKKR
jgi:hypothetical protein